MRKIFLLLIGLTAVSGLLSGCATEQQYPGGDNDDRRKAPAAAAATPAAAPADNSRAKPGSSEAGGK